VHVLGLGFRPWANGGARSLTLAGRRGGWRGPAGRLRLSKAIHASAVWLCCPPGRLSPPLNASSLIRAALPALDLTSRSLLR